MDNITSDGSLVEKGGSAPQPFYNEFSQINDPKVAEDVAYIGKDHGRDAAILRENALREGHETGLTEKERKNLEIAEMLAEEFPDAFVRGVDDKGTEIFATGINAVHGNEVVSELLSLSPSKGEELLKDFRIISNEVDNYLPIDSGKILYDLTNYRGENVFISKYGISIGLKGEFNIKDNAKFARFKTSIWRFSDEELVTFFKILKFLDKVGKAGKEIAIEEERGKKSVEDFRNLAQQIKNS